MKRYNKTDDMIYYIIAKKSLSAIGHYLCGVEFDLLSKIKPIFYHQLNKHLGQMKSGVLIFSDIESLNKIEREELSIVHHELLEKTNLKILNHPKNSMRRYDLLNSMFENGINEFRVFRPTDNLDEIQFPVFLRFENDHTGKQSELIFNKESLTNTIETFGSMSYKQSIKSLNRLGSDELLITEFCDTSDQNGVFRKYSAFYIDGQVIPRHLFFDVDWCLKMPGIKTDLFVEEENEYIKTNPHKNTIDFVFKTGRIDFGRIDYSLKDGNLQVWEINTNPTILKRRMLDKKSSRYNTHQTFRSKFKNEIMHLDEKYTFVQDKTKFISPKDIVSAYAQLLRYETVEILAKNMKRAIKLTNSSLMANLYAGFKSYLNKPNS